MSKTDLDRETIDRLLPILNNIAVYVAPIGQKTMTFSSAVEKLDEEKSNLVEKIREELTKIQQALKWDRVWPMGTEKTIPNIFKKLVKIIEMIRDLESKLFGPIDKKQYRKIIDCVEELEVIMVEIKLVYC